jgi:hypothetical protein
MGERIGSLGDVWRPRRHRKRTDEQIAEELETSKPIDVDRVIKRGRADNAKAKQPPRLNEYGKLLEKPADGTK